MEDLFRAPALVLGAMFLMAGCDKLPWGKPPAEAPPATAQSAAAPGRAAVAPGDVVATVNGVNISKQDMEFMVQQRKAQAAMQGRPWQSLTEDELKQLLDEMVSNELMSQDAIARGLDRATETRQRWEFLRRGFFVDEWARAKQSQLEISSKEVEEFYERNKLGFRLPERRKVRQLVFSSEEHAKAALVQLLEGADVSTIAERSLRPEAARAPLADQWILRSALKAALAPDDATVRALTDSVLEQAAFAIDKINGVSNYVKGADNNYYIFQLTAREEERQRPISEAWDQIKSLLTFQKFRQELEQLHSNAKVDTYPERLQSVTP